MDDQRRRLQKKLRDIDIFSDIERKREGRPAID